MLKRALFVIILGALCVGTALAGTTRDVTYNLTGKQPGASFSTYIGGVDVNVNIDPDVLPDGSAGYDVDIEWEDPSVHDIHGLVLPSAISFTSLSNPLQVNISKDSFYQTGNNPTGYGDGVAEFTSLVGTFTPYTSPGSYKQGQTGKSWGTQTHPDGSQDIFTTTGSYEQISATFEGTLSVTGGPYSLTVTGPNPNGSMTVVVGTQRDITTTP